LAGHPPKIVKIKLAILPGIDSIAQLVRYLGIPWHGKSSSELGSVMI
jgi:hypothetical protein